MFPIASRSHLVLLAALAVIVLLLLASLAFLYPWPSIPYFAIDFNVYLAAASTLSAGDNPYVLADLSAHAAPGTINEVLSYSYPPLLAELFVPLTLLPADVASRLWLLLNLSISPLSALLLIKSTGWKPQPPILAAVILGSVLFLPSLYTYVSGQASLWSLLFVSVGIHAMSRDRETLSGAAFALAWAKPHPLLLLPLLLLRKRRALIAFVGITLLSLIVVAPQLLQWGQTALRGYHSNVAPAEFWYQATAFALLHRLGTVGWLVHGVLALASAALVFNLSGRIAWQPTAVIVVALGLLISPYLGRSDIILALAPILLMLRDWQTARGPATLALLAWGCPLVSIMLFAFTPADAALLPLVWGGLVQWTVAAAAVWYLWVKVPALREQLLAPSKA